MLQINNATGLPATVFASPDPDGVESLYAVVKGTFTLGATVAVAPEQVPIVPAAKHYGDPAKTSIAVPSDLTLTKPSTDVLLVGSAWAPAERPTWQTDVSLSAGPVTKTVRVFADRVWSAGPTGASVEWVTPFVRMPLVWERAFGGADQTDNGPTAEPRNPVGAGFRAPRGTKQLHGMPLPNLEDPAAPISSWKEAPPPAGFAPVAPHWEPRKSLVGTYDEAWQRRRSPYLPLDFDPRFFQVAPTGLVTPQYLRGGEIVDVRGATPSGVLRFQLPSVDVRLTFLIDGAAEVRRADLDTVLIEPDAGRLILVWRSALRCDKKTLRVREVIVAAEAAA